MGVTVPVTGAGVSVHGVVAFWLSPFPFLHDPDVCAGYLAEARGGGGGIYLSILGSDSPLVDAAVTLDHVQAFNNSAGGDRGPGLSDPAHT